ncbi:hypothetical protein IFR05_006908 [Cadophora sp. M221]|nr:hypothetical protein IFR05_006908 [Cadophora sp. M221]
MAVAVPEAEPEADAEMLEQRAIGSYCQQSGQPDKGTCQKESWCKASAQVGIVSTGDCPYDPDDVKCCYIPDSKGDLTLQGIAPVLIITNAASIEEGLGFMIFERRENGDF